MNLHVLGAVGELGEGLVAARRGAHKRPRAGVPPQVVAEVVLPAERSRRAIRQGEACFVVALPHCLHSPGPRVNE